jgi:predicted dehydrogenase
LTGPGFVPAAIIGVGKVAATHAQAYRDLPDTRLVAVCGRSEARARAFGQAFGVAAYTDPATMLERERPVAVSICTPHPSHPELVELCARLGVNVLVEKPLAPDLAGCDRAIEACAAAGVKLGVVSQRRLYPPVQRLRRAIEEGRLGRPILAEVTVLGWRDDAYYRSDPWRGRWDTEGGGVLVNQTPHHLDLLQWLMGPVEELYGRWDNLSHPSIEVEDTAVAVVRFRSGALGSLVLSNSQQPGLYGRIHVHGSNGASAGVETESGSTFISGVTASVEPPINDIWTVPGEEDLLPVWQAEDRACGTDVMTGYHALQIADFIAAVAADRQPLVDGPEGRKVVEIITAVYRSQRDGRPVSFPLETETGRLDRDGRIDYRTLSHREGT